jgi:hypothetical protein
MRDQHADRSPLLNRHHYKNEIILPLLKSCTNSLLLPQLQIIQQSRYFYYTALPKLIYSSHTIIPFLYYHPLKYYYQLTQYHPPNQLSLSLNIPSISMPHHLPHLPPTIYLHSILPLLPLLSSRPHHHHSHTSFSSQPIPSFSPSSIQR